MLTPALPRRCPFRFSLVALRSSACRIHHAFASRLILAAEQAQESFARDCLVAGESLPLQLTPTTAYQSIKTMTSPPPSLIWRSALWHHCTLITKSSHRKSIVQGDAYSSNFASKGYKKSWPCPKTYTEPTILTLERPNNVAINSKEDAKPLFFPDYCGKLDDGGCCNDLIDWTNKFASDSQLLIGSIASTQVAHQMVPSIAEAFALLTRSLSMSGMCWQIQERQSKVL